MASVITSESISLLPGSASRVNSTVDAQTTPIKNKDFKKEVIFYFFNNMLEAIVDSWEAEGVLDMLESVDSGNNMSGDRECAMSAEIASDEEVEVVEAEEQEFSMKEFSTISKLDSKPKHKKQSVTGNRKSKAKKSRKSIRKLTTFSDTKHVQIIDDNSWMIDSVEETALIIFKNGNVYEGPISGKLMEGTGKFTWANGTTYVGTFKEGELTGSGILTLPHTNHYSGGFLRGYRHGEGEMGIRESEATFSGTWRVGNKHGRGWQLFAPNNWYDGFWENDAMNGYGNRQYPSGSRYEGNWKNGMRDGKGIAVMRNNDYYNGEWKEGKRCGYGEYTWSAFYNKTFSVPVQSSYIGYWEDDNRHGIGVVNFGTEGGSRYAGCFEKNLKHGPGVVICENGSIIEANPLFLADKPVHLTNTGSFIISEDNSVIDTAKNKGNSIEDTHAINIPLIHDYQETSLNEYVAMERKMSIFKTISKQIHQPGNKLDNCTLAHIELCKMVFPKISENHYSLCIPVNTPSELINLNYHLMKTDELKDDNCYLTFSKLTLPIDLKHQSVKTACCDETSPQYQNSRVSSFSFASAVSKRYMEHEERKIRKAITTHLPRLRAIYHHYTIVSSLKDVPFKTLLIRLFLWQFYRDCMIPEKGISLYKIDMLMEEIPDIELETEHNPFEIIYFWQFLHSLLTIALNLYGKYCAACVNVGVLTSAFIKLLEEDIYPNYGQHKGCLLFDYVDVLPIRAAYSWFMEFKQPFTALNFLQISSTIKRADPPDNFLTNEIKFFVEMGINAFAIAHEMKYLKDEIPNIQTEPFPQEQIVRSVDNYKDIFFLRTLGAKKVLSIIKDICPKVMEGNDIVNIQYEMTFYEFYEAVLKCSEAYIEKILKDAKLKKMENSPVPTLQTASFITDKEKKKSKRNSNRKNTLSAL